MSRRQDATAALLLLLLAQIKRSHLGLFLAASLIKFDVCLCVYVNLSRCAISV